MALTVVRRRFTVDEYHRMAEAGILGEDDRVELIEGEIVTMSPIGSRHASCVAKLTALFSRVQEQWIVWVQNPIRLGKHSEPQPDVALLKPREDFYATAHPGPEDILLVVEIAETSTDYDRTVKVPLYARFGIPEVWLVDLAGEHIEVYRKPSPQGYREVQHLRRGRKVIPQELPCIQIAVDDILGTQKKEK